MRNGGFLGTLLVFVNCRQHTRCRRRTSHASARLASNSLADETSILAGGANDPINSVFQRLWRGCLFDVLAGPQLYDLARIGRVLVEDDYNTPSWLTETLAPILIIS